MSARIFKTFIKRGDMTQRPTGILTLITALVGLLCLSLGYNLHLCDCIQKLENSIVCNYWVSPSEYEQIKKELDRLEKVEYK